MGWFILKHIFFTIFTNPAFGVFLRTAFSASIHFSFANSGIGLLVKTNRESIETPWTS
jgi:hypothetical protein